MPSASAKPLTTPTAIKEAFASAIDFWTPLLDLSAWRIKVIYDETGNNPEKDDGYFAGCEASPEYELATITCNVAGLLAYGFDCIQVEAVALHELCHIVLWLLGNLVTNPVLPEDIIVFVEETATEDMTQALLRTKYGLSATELSRPPLAP